MENRGRNSPIIGRDSLPIFGEEPCPYCNGVMVLDKGSSIGWIKESARDKYIYRCEHFPQCDTYVGTHPGTIDPLGKGGNRETRYWRMIAHNHYFDPIWKYQKSLNPHALSNAPYRPNLYRWLAKEMGMPEIHFGGFTVEECKQACSLLDRILRGNMAMTQHRDMLVNGKAPRLWEYYTAETFTGKMTLYRGEEIIQKNYE